MILKNFHSKIFLLITWINHNLGHAKEKWLVDQYDHKTAKGAAKWVVCYDVNPEIDPPTSKQDNEKNIANSSIDHANCDVRLENDLVKSQIWSLIDKDFDAPSRLEELQRILSGEVKGDVEAAQKEFASIDDDCTVISTYSLEKLLDEINNKKNTAKNWELEDGEINVSSDEPKPHLNQFETQNNNAFANPKR